MGNQQLIIEGAGPPGAPDSYYSEETTLTAAVAGSPAFGRTLIPEAGFIFFEDLAANVSVELRLTLSPETFATLIAAGSQGQSWSDGANLFVNNSSGSPSPVKYFVLGRKP